MNISGVVNLQERMTIQSGVQWTLSHYKGDISPDVTVKYLRDRGFAEETKTG